MSRCLRAVIQFFPEFEKLTADGPFAGSQNQSRFCLFRRMQNFLPRVRKRNRLLRHHNPPRHFVNRFAQVFFRCLHQQHSRRSRVNHAGFRQSGNALKIRFLRRTTSSVANDKSRHTCTKLRIAPSQVGRVSRFSSAARALQRWLRVPASSPLASGIAPSRPTAPSLSASPGFAVALPTAWRLLP